MFRSRVPQLRVAAFAVLGCLIAAAVPAKASDIRYFTTGTAPMPFSPAVRAGHIVYTSGVIGLAADGSLPADFGAQAEGAMQAVAAELKLAGASMDDAVKCDVALTDMKNWAAFNTVYVKHFTPGHLPVRMASGVTALARGAAVEVQCEAFVR